MFTGKIIDPTYQDEPSASIIATFTLMLQIKMDNMSRYCTCAGEYQLLISKKDYAVHLKTFRGIAKHYQMPLLLGLIDWVLKMNPEMACLF